LVSARLPGRTSTRAADWPSWKVVVADPGQQASSPGPDDKANLEISQADLAGLLKGGLVVLSQPGQAGKREIVVVLVNREGHSPLDQSLDPRRDGRPLGKLTGHSEDPSPSPRQPNAPSCREAGAQPWRRHHTRRALATANAPISGLDRAKLLGSAPPAFRLVQVAPLPKKDSKAERGGNLGCTNAT